MTGYDEIQCAYEKGFVDGRLKEGESRVSQFIEGETALLRHRVAELEKCLTLLKHKNGCWCAMSIGHPNYREHSDACKRTLLVMKP